MTVATYFAFFGLAAALAVTPGPDTALSLRYGIRSRRAGLLAALGSSLAVLVWAALAATGVAVVLASSEVAHNVLTGFGGAYLVFLGVRALLAVRRQQEARSAAGAATAESTATGAIPYVAPGVSGKAAFWGGVTTCLTNPKTGLFFLAVFPQFTPVGAAPAYVLLVLGGTVFALILSYLIVIVLLADAANRWLARPAVTRGIETATGVILASLGVYMLVSTGFAIFS